MGSSRLFNRNKFLGIAAAALVFGCTSFVNDVNSFSTRGDSVQSIGSDLPGTFRTDNKSNIALTDFQGKAVVLLFGYTQCPDVCPTTMQHWQQVFSLLETEEFDSTQLVFVTVDPDRDSPELLSGYMNYFNPRFLGLHADKNTIKSLLSELHTFARKVPSRTPGQYSMDHSGSAYLVDNRGVMVDEVAFGTSVQDSAVRLKKVLAQSS